MYSTEIDVGYFAAGIAAHLASDDQLDWSKILISKSQLVEELGNVVTSWKRQVPDLVAYRSFKPFYPLMKESQPLAVKMWAVWAVHHVCCNKVSTNNSFLKKYEPKKLVKSNESISRICIVIFFSSDNKKLVK